VGTEKEIVVLDPDKKRSQDLCDMLAERDYRPRPLHALPDLDIYLKERTCLVAILDLNAPSINNRVIRELTLRNPGVYFLGLTKHRFNPELEESICYHIYACLTKPVDPDELFYWLKSIFEDEADPKDELGSGPRDSM